MPAIDNDEIIRDRAYALWETAGRPAGLEHEHWAEAKRQVEAERFFPIVAITAIDAKGWGAEPRETDRMRRSLYAPEPFSFELFGQECPRIDLPIVLRAA